MRNSHKIAHMKQQPITAILASNIKKKRAELKLSAFDLLNRNVGVSRNVSQNQIVDQSYNVINQYFLIGFTYSLQKSGLGGGGPRVMTMRMN